MEPPARVGGFLFQARNMYMSTEWELPSLLILMVVLLIIVYLIK